MHYQFKGGQFLLDGTHFPRETHLVPSHTVCCLTASQILSSYRCVFLISLLRMSAADRRRSEGDYKHYKRVSEAVRESRQTHYSSFRGRNQERGDERHERWDNLCVQAAPVP